MSFFTSIIKTSFKLLPNLFKFLVKPPFIGVQLSLYNLIYALLYGSIISITGSAYSLRLAVHKITSKYSLN